MSDRMRLSVRFVEEINRIVVSKVPMPLRLGVSGLSEREKLHLAQLLVEIIEDES